MRAPFQDGDFPAPVKYGYLNVGAVEHGPAELRGRTVFCLYPHQTRYVVPADAVVVRPRRRAARARRARRHRGDRGQRALGRRAAASATGSPSSARAWSAAASPGCSRRIPRRRGELVDVDPAGPRSRPRSGVGFALPDEAAGERDLVVHASATAAGLQRSLRAAAPEGTVLELSWYGDRRSRVSLGGAFHSRRLTMRASQVGHWSRRPAAARRTTRDRLALALELLRDPALRRAAHRRVAASTSCPTCWRGWPTAGCRRSATRIDYGGG